MMHCEGLLRQEVSRFGQGHSLEDCFPQGLPPQNNFFAVQVGAGFRSSPRRLFKNVQMCRRMPAPFKLRCSIPLLWVFYSDAVGILFE